MKSSSLRGLRLAIAAVAALACVIAPGAQGAGKDDGGKPEARLVNGVPATIEAHPWQVALAINDALYPSPVPALIDRFACGGTLIAPTVVLTASHCVYELWDDSVGYEPANTFDAVTGRTTLSAGGGQVTNVLRLYYPVQAPDGSVAFERLGGPDLGTLLYNPDLAFQDWDVALLELDRAVSATPIQLAGPGEEATWSPGRIAHVSGWGGTLPGLGPELQKPSNQLLAGDLAIVSDSECDARVGSNIVPSIEFCAGDDAGGRVVCYGDSGGPAVAPVELGAAVGARLIGTTSFLEAACGGLSGFTRNGADPIRGAIQRTVLAIDGVDPVGVGARPLEPPRTKFEDKPKRKIKTRKRKRKVKFELTASEPAVFQCKLDRRPYKACGPKVKFKVRRGKHRFKVRAIDSLGQADPKPAKAKFKVKKRRR